MTYTEQFDYTSGQTTYVKLRPLDEATWANGIVACTENGSTGEYLTGNLLDDAKYVILKQAGGSPAAADERIGRIDPTSAQVVEIDAKIGTPVGTGGLTDLSAGQAVISAQVSGVETLIGTPANGDISTDIANHDAKLSSHDTDVKILVGVPNTDLATDINDHDQRLIGYNTTLLATLGTPADTDLATDIAAIQTTVDDILAVLGTPVLATMSLDIAAVQSTVDTTGSDLADLESTVLKIPRASAGLLDGETVHWQMVTFTDKDNVLIRYLKI